MQPSGPFSCPACGDAEYAQNDADLKGLRGHPGFAAVMGGIRSRRVGS